MRLTSAARSALLLTTGVAAMLVCPTTIGAAPAMQVAHANEAAFRELLDYVQAQGTTGLLIVQDGKTVLRRDWPLPAQQAVFRVQLTDGTAPDGSLREDVASQQKSLVSVLVGIAVDRKLIDPARPVSRYLGYGWSKAAVEQERRITVLNLLEMNSGLATDFTYEAPAGTRFRYNTEVYSTLKAVLAKAGGQPLEALTAAWLTLPLGMDQTRWRQRRGVRARALNPSGLVTTPADLARFGQMVLDGGRAADGRRVVSADWLQASLRPSPTNPAYGRLWWLNGSEYGIRPTGRRIEGPMIPEAPRDMVAALGALERELFVVPSRKLIFVRLGPKPRDIDFPRRIWPLINRALKAASSG